MRAWITTPMAAACTRALAFNASHLRQARSAVSVVRVLPAPWPRLQAPSYTAPRSALARRGVHVAASEASGGGEAVVTIYDSPQPGMVMAAYRLLAAKAVLASTAAATSLYEQCARFESVSDLAATLMGDVVPGAPDVSLHYTLGFAVVAVIARACAKTLGSRIVTRVDVRCSAQDAAVLRTNAGGVEDEERDVAEAAASGKPYDSAFAARARRMSAIAAAVTPAATAAHTICIHHPTLWGSTTVHEVPRADIACSPPNTLTQCFRVRSQRGRMVENYIFPVAGWRSDCLPYLRALMFTDFFVAEERPPPADVELIAIEGFGPYRPAQFADPHHARYGELSHRGADAVAVEGTPFIAAHGTVWAHFDLPPPLSLEQRRAIERDAALYGVPKVRGELLPRLAAPVTLMLDGTQHSGPRRVRPLDGAAADGSALPTEAAATDAQASNAALPLTQRAAATSS
ncbi:hypothetical protein EON68_01150 [archaeon]|nr:MAG: hypothetical protein EON68_01150 [archaeon]